MFARFVDSDFIDASADAAHGFEVSRNLAALDEEEFVPRLAAGRIRKDLKSDHADPIHRIGFDGIAKPPPDHTSICMHATIRHGFPYFSFHCRSRSNAWMGVSASTFVLAS